ncbi:hypothetical protein ACIP4S_31560 [Streptomyces chartreusis]|uniref:hypothetical protein n=1 Tax=Streptomyces chartreusis TaxID=1969 RepID=UPI00382E58B4
MDLRAGVVAAGRDWYERTALDPDSLAGHPAVIETAKCPPRRGNLLRRRELRPPAALLNPLPETRKPSTRSASSKS